MGVRIGAVILGAVMAVAGCSSEPEPKFANGKTEIENIVAAQMAVEAQLRDPKSAEWGTIVVREKDGITSVCGMVNAKNGFGGYAGERPFVYSGGIALLMSDDSQVAVFERMFLERCAA
jgi:hypothetical protein